jgi:hypothetical protein
MHSQVYHMSQRDEAKKVGVSTVKKQQSTYAELHRQTVRVLEGPGLRWLCSINAPGCAFAVSVTAAAEHVPTKGPNSPGRDVAHVQPGFWDLDLALKAHQSGPSQPTATQMDAVGSAAASSTAHTHTRYPRLHTSHPLYDAHRR